MTIAWFRPSPAHVPSWLDDTAALLAELATTHRVTVIDEALAHDFPWTHARTPYDLCVYELGDSAAHAYMWPYLLHYPGLLRLRAPSLHASRAIALNRARRRLEYRSEVGFSGWDMLRGAMLAARLVVVGDPFIAARLERDLPDVAVRCVPFGTGQGSAAALADTRPRRQQGGATTFAMLDPARESVLRRAASRAAQQGAQVNALVGASEQLLPDTDVIVALDWPASEWPVAALLAMAHQKAAIVLETEATAGWPALDPQTWQPRHTDGAEPMVVSLDPRDEEHSLMLAMRRLSSDEALRHALAANGRTWWRTHATLAHAVEGWRRVLDEAVRRQPPARPPDWPGHLSADGSEYARAILRPFGVTVDFLR